MRGNFYLGGGGSETDEENVWAEAFTSGQTVAFWPFATTGAEARRAASSWFSSALVSRGRFTIQEWISPADHDPALPGVDVVAIPGGNTFDLLHELHAADLLEPLLEHLRRGGCIYGGSAGAILAGTNIDIALAMDPNNVGLRDTAGLDLLRGCDVMPHFTAGQLSQAQDHSQVAGRRVLCIPEKGGVVASPNGTVRNVGPADVYLTTPDNYERLSIGEPISLTDAR